MDISFSLSLAPADQPGTGTGSATVPVCNIVQPASNPRRSQITYIEITCSDTGVDDDFDLSIIRSTARGTPTNTLVLTDPDAATPNLIVDTTWSAPPTLVTLSATVRPLHSIGFNARVPYQYYDWPKLLKLAAVAGEGLALMLVAATTARDLRFTIGLHED